MCKWSTLLSGATSASLEVYWWVWRIHFYRGSTSESCWRCLGKIHVLRLQSASQWNNFTVLSPGGKQVNLALSQSRQMVCWGLEAVRLHFLVIFMGNRSKTARFNPQSRCFSFTALTPARVYRLDSFSWPEADLMRGRSNFSWPSCLYPWAGLG